MKILITNDDGIDSEGIYTLVKEFENDNEVFVAAPDSQRSASGHAITIDKPVLVTKVNIRECKSKAFSIYGTPADCVKIAIDKLYKEKFDIVISGINYGANLGSDVIYSGTVSAAMEASMYNIPSIAISNGINSGNVINYSIAAKTTRRILNSVIDSIKNTDTVLNVNVPQLPENDIKGIKLCRLGKRKYNDCYNEINIKNNGVEYKLQGWPEDVYIENTDVSNFKDGYITLTPLHYDMTSYDTLSIMKKWNIITL